jgi:hypothetical protein
VTFEQHENRITGLETRLDNNAATPKTITPPGEEPVQYGPYENDIVYRAYSVGNIGDMYTNTEHYATVAKTIGSIDGNNESIAAAIN